MRLKVAVALLVMEWEGLGGIKVKVACNRVVKMCVFSLSQSDC